MEIREMIKVIPSNGSSMAVHQGRTTRAYSGKPGQDCIILDGTPVRREELDALFVEDMIFDWLGKKFKLYKYADQVLHDIYLDHDWVWDRENGLDGSYYMGWYCHAAESDVENVWVEKIDLLASWRHKNEVGEQSSHDEYRYLRPATPEEWIRTDSDSSS